MRHKTRVLRAKQLKQCHLNSTLTNFSIRLGVLILISDVKLSIFTSSGAALLLGGFLKV